MITRSIYPLFQINIHSIKRRSWGVRNTVVKIYELRLGCYRDTPYRFPVSHSVIALVRICCGIPLTGMIPTLAWPWMATSTFEGYKSPLVFILILFHCYCATPSTSSCSCMLCPHELDQLLFYYPTRIK